MSGVARPAGGAGQAVPAANRGLGDTRLRQLADQLSTRDLSVLTSISIHRFLTTSHLERLHFLKHASPQSGSRSARRVLSRLADLRLVVALARRVGGIASGSTPAVWYTTLSGQRLLLLAAQAITADDSRGTSSRVRDPSVRFTLHCLAVADVHLELVEAARAGAFGLTAIDLEPRCWRSYAGQYGDRDIVKPDLAAATSSADGEYEDRWFIEVDLGSEHLPTVLAKCAQYETYRRLGDEQQRHGVFPLVLWVTPDPKRAAKLQTAIRGSRSLDHSLYRVVVTSAVAGVVAAGGDSLAENGGPS